MLRSLVGSEMCIRDRYQRRVRGSPPRMATNQDPGLSGKMDAAPVAQPAADSNWASMIPSTLPTSLSAVGGLAVSKGLGLVQPRMGPWTEFMSCAHVPVSYTHLTLPTKRIV
eukprot:TRINITY_DN28304_c0_g1_i1.p1 TRINITY_DN28304_c0_g1~~TRINITY_DN28304_c0_g1_i1.p1  ORF type:complete len:112 (-),score=21.80 TRINITY_DN28304_c0_g1_i1:118-453(-)